MYTISNTLFIGKVYYHFPFLASTNSYAANLLSKNNPSDGTVISTYNQTKGRGQIGSKWESEPDKNISLSIILYPDFLKINQQFLLNQAVSLAVHDFITKYIDYGLKVKWPNDIYINEFKIAGILIQNTLSASIYRSAIVGIGININQDTFLSEAPNPTSLNIETGLEFNLDTLVNELCMAFEKRYLQLKSGQIDLIKSDYLRHLYKFQKDMIFQNMEDESFFKGKIVGVQENGLLEIQNGSILETFNLKTIRLM